jgi:tungstate transport system substrate-binding protein
MNPIQKVSLLVTLLLAVTLSAQAEPSKVLRIATTTSTENSGLLAVLHPLFEQQYNVRLDVIAVGTGKALKLGENGDVDVVFVHAPKAEQAFVDAGFGVARHAVMHNDFIIVGPISDPAKIKQTGKIELALKRIYDTQSLFVSRGDDSGTDKKEKTLWVSAKLTPKGSWYASAGQGMGAVLRIADDKQAYTLTDRGTYLAQKHKLSLSVLFKGDQLLFNPYHIIAINPNRHSYVKTELAQKYINYVTGAQGQKIIADYKLAGEQLFYPDAQSGNE